MMNVFSAIVAASAIQATALFSAFAAGMFFESGEKGKARFWALLAIINAAAVVVLLVRP